MKRSCVWLLVAVWIGCMTQAWALDDSVGPDGIDARVLHDEPISLTGQDVRVGVLGGKIDTTHAYLTVGGNGGTGSAGAMATQVAGIVNSKHPDYTGVAPGSRMYGYNVGLWEDSFYGASWLTRPAQGAIAAVLIWCRDFFTERSQA